MFSTKTSTSLGANSWNDLTGFNAGKVTYKATRSERNAYFTGIQPDNVLDFDAAATQDEPAKFIALYPQTATGAESYTVSGGTETVVLAFRKYQLFRLRIIWLEMAFMKRLPNILLPMAMLLKTTKLQLVRMYK